MKKTAPHYLLFTEAKNSTSHENGSPRGGRWRFVLEQIGTATRIEESDDEPGTWGERLQLLSVVRGLEAIDQPSRITLVTSSKYVGRGIRRSLTQWRENNWQWEHFGQMTPIKCHDLWQRIDRSMQIHQINCRVWQFDPPHARTQTPRSVDQSESWGKAPSGRQTPLATIEDNSASQPPSSSLTNWSRQTSSFPKNSNRMTLSLKRSRAMIGNSMAHASQVSSMLDERIKPMGQGKAYGYSVG